MDAVSRHTTAPIGRFFGLGAASEDKNVVELRGVVGSEKLGFFQDPEVIEALRAEGFAVDVDAMGSRAMAGIADASGIDFVFPANQQASQKFAESHPTLGSDAIFYSPMAIATFPPILTVLERAGAATNTGDGWMIDAEKFVDLQRQGTRWRDLGAEYPSPRAVYASTTDLRSSNSASLWAAILAWGVSGGRLPGNPVDGKAVGEEVSRLLLEQGYSESSSASPFNDYLSLGIGSKPMVVVYESQFLEQQLSDESRVTGDMVLAYPNPTIVSFHTFVALDEDATRLGEVLRTNSDIRRLALKHGFRVGESGEINDVLASDGVPLVPASLNTIDQPNFETMEAIIEVFEGKLQPSAQRGTQKD